MKIACCWTTRERESWRQQMVGLEGALDVRWSVCCGGWHPLGGCSFRGRPGSFLSDVVVAATLCVTSPELLGSSDRDSLCEFNDSDVAELIPPHGISADDSLCASTVSVA